MNQQKNTIIHSTINNRNAAIEFDEQMDKWIKSGLYKNMQKNKQKNVE